MLNKKKLAFVYNCRFYTTFAALYSERTLYRKTKISLTFFTFVFCQSLFADDLFTEAQTVAPVARPDVWSPLRNAASLAEVASVEAGVHYQNRFAVKELSTKSAQIAVPTHLLNVGAAFSYFGYENYNENIANLSFARKFSEKFSLSAAVDYYSVYFSKSEGSKGAVIAQVGIASQPADHLFIGFQAFNPVQTNIKTPVLEKEIPAVFSLGAAYYFSERVLWGLQIDKEIAENAQLATEFEYRFLDYMLLRVGCTAHGELMPSAGFGLGAYHFWLDTNFKYHADLGITSNIGLTFKL